MSEEERKAQRGERLKALTQVARDTDMGRLLRRFWHPVGVARELAQGAAKPVRLLGEDLTLYRGESGRPYLVGARCAHRLTLLHTGWVIGEEIRCIYHGWQYDGSGHCTKRPAEKEAAPPKICIAGYPLHEYGGLIFAYLGEGAAPDFDLPRKDVFERQGCINFAKVEIWPCNWFQMVENSLDAVHVSFVHQMGRLGSFGDTVTAAIPELHYIETEAGIRQIATRSRSNVRVSDWTFPNNNHISQPGLTKEDPWIDVGIWMSPLDDTHAARFTIWSVPAASPESDRGFIDYCAQHGAYNPAEHHRDLFEKGGYPDDTVMELTSAQDYVAQLGQGAIADRQNEWLGQSDAGIVFLRRIFLRELEAIRKGAATKAWRKLDRPAELPVQVA